MLLIQSSVHVNTYVNVNLFVWYVHCEMRTFVGRSFTEMLCYDSCLVIDSKFGFYGLGLDYGTFKTLLRSSNV